MTFYFVRLGNRTTLVANAAALIGSHSKTK